MIEEITAALSNSSIFESLDLIATTSQTGKIRIDLYFESAYIGFAEIKNDNVEFIEMLFGYNIPESAIAASATLKKEFPASELDFFAEL